MKKIVWCIAASGLMMLQSCDEKGVPIGTVDHEGSVDTAYKAAVETPQDRIVLIEEFTGASCTNCPDGHTRLAAILAANEDRVVAVSYHTYGGGTIFEPVHKDGISSKYDFRNTDATNIAQYIYGGVGSIPVGGVDRIVVDGSRQLGRDIWKKETDDRLVVASPVNLHLSSEYDPGENEVTISVKVAYTAAVTMKNALTISVIESNIIDAQEYTTYIDTAYVHNHVLRQFLTSYSGKPVLDSLDTKASGQVFEYRFKFKPDPTLKWNLDNCNILAFISNTDPSDKLVLQSAEVPLKQ